MKTPFVTGLLARRDATLFNDRPPIWRSVWCIQNGIALQHTDGFNPERGGLPKQLENQSTAICLADWAPLTRNLELGKVARRVIDQASRDGTE